MPSLDDLKKRIKSVKSTQKITKAMKMVAAAKLRRAQESAEKGRPFSEKMNNIILNLSNSISNKDNASKFLVGTGKDTTHLCVVITADRGLCGGFNTNICRKARNYFDKILKENKTLKIFAVGSKGYDQLKRIYGKYIVEKVNFKGFKKITYEEAEHVGKIIIKLFNESQFDVCNIFYNKFKNVITQIPQEQQLIPIETKKKEKERIVLMTTKASTSYSNFKFNVTDTLLFGRESAGVPEKIHKLVDKRLKIPLSFKKRSLNLASSVAIALAESLRQNKLI